MGKNGRVYAVDSYAESIATLKEQLRRENIDNVEAIVADVTKAIPLEDGVIDVCLMANVLHGFLVNREVEGSMRKTARVVKAGGTLAVVDFKKIEGPGPPISIRMTPQEVEKIIAPYGFKKTKVVDVGPYHYIVTFSAKSLPGPSMSSLNDPLT